MFEFKSFPVTEFKAIKTADEPGTFEAIVAVFGNVDYGNDRIKRGAFKRTLEEKGLPPIVWSHNWDVPPIGTTLEAVESNEGLRIKGRLFIGEGEDHSVARQVYAAMSAEDGNGQPTLREFSFGYEVRGSTLVEEEGKEIRELHDVELLEAGPTLVGMNPATRHLGIKAHRQYADWLETRTTDLKGHQAADKPAPNDTQVSEEELAMIDALKAADPIHLKTRST